MHVTSHRRPSAATVISVIALFVALGGTSYAAVTLPRNSVGSTQVIDRSLSKGDLSRKAVAALKGKTGAQGANGAQGGQGATGPAGPAGPNGAAGAQGTQGPAGTTGPAGAIGPAGPFPDGNMPSGKTLRGNWITSSHTSGGGSAFSTISFGYTLASAPTAHLLDAGATATTACPGSVTNPQALAGYLCIYTRDSYNISGRSLCDPSTNVCGVVLGNRYGIAVEADTSGTGNFYTWGTWAVTSP